MFLKKGIDKAKGKNIYPHPNQTKTGNCAAYAAAACMYAFGLDHESSLIPPADGAKSEEGKFEHQISKMIERFQELIYTKPSNSQAEAFRKYINEAGLNCKFDVSEPPLTVNEYDHIAGKKIDISNIFHMMDEVRRCQDVIMNVKWKKADGTIARHAVGLVGGEENKLLINNPWGPGSMHQNPDDAATTGFTEVKMKGDDKGNISFPLGGNDATIYEFIMVCPARPHKVAINSQVRPPSERKPGAAVTTTIDYQVVNRALKNVNGLAIALPGLAPEHVRSFQSPLGWTSSIWYRQNEPTFDILAPEIVLNPKQRDFAGVLWRVAERSKGGIRKGARLSGFSLQLELPELDPAAEEWQDDPLGHGIVLEEGFGNSGAWHVNALTPSRVDLRKKFSDQLRKGIKPPKGNRKRG